MRLIALMTAILLAVTSCSGNADRADVYSAATAALGESIAILGWNMSVANLRFEADHVLVDVEASPSAEGGAHTAPADIRFGLYGALVHPLETGAGGGCDDVAALDIQPLSATTPDRMSGTVCLGPLRDRAQVRGVYVYSPRDRIAGTTVAYPAAFPVGVLPTNENDVGLTMRTNSVDAFRADGAKLDPAAIGDRTALKGKG